MPEFAVQCGSLTYRVGLLDVTSTWDSPACEPFTTLLYSDLQSYPGAVMDRDYTPGGTSYKVLASSSQTECAFQCQVRPSVVALVCTGMGVIIVVWGYLSVHQLIGACLWRFYL